MTVTLGILALLETQPGKGSELAEFLKEARELAIAEEGTVSWYAFKISDTSYGTFDTFATYSARTAHINGQIPPPWPRLRSTCWQVTQTSGPSTSLRSSNEPSGDLSSSQQTVPADAAALICPEPRLHAEDLARRSGRGRANQDRQDENHGSFGTKFMIPNEPWCYRRQTFRRAGSKPDAVAPPRC
ncbi:MAG: hypothetical protein WAK83_13790 [Trebonia sp.]|uniref:putative quinol monooxygenase n=1 Tax=Trebonia sp. TaxID=2767075 RepID=UPI003BB0D545